MKHFKIHEEAYAPSPTNYNNFLENAIHHQFDGQATQKKPFKTVIPPGNWRIRIIVVPDNTNESLLKSHTIEAHIDTDKPKTAIYKPPTYTTAAYISATLHKVNP